MQDNPKTCNFNTQKSINMETITLNLYKFSELSEDAKKKAIEKHLYINVDCEWWDFIYYDAKKVIGVEISGFDIYRKSIDIKFIEDAEDVAHNIIQEYGQDTDMYKLAADFIVDYSNLIMTDDPSPSDIEDREEEFLNGLGEEYLSMLEKDYDWLTSDEAIADTLELNEYTFLENGKRY
jgi:hypothetical protein